MFSDKEDGKQGKVKTIFGKGTKIVGDLKTKGSVRVEGEITGKVEAKGDVFIGEAGEIQTEIEARKVVIAGNVSADIIAHDKLEILPSGVLKGDIKCNKLVIEEGATFVGNSSTLDKEDKKSSARKKKKTNKKSNQSKKSGSKAGNKNQKKD